MSRYQLNKAMRRILYNLDPSLGEQFLRDPYAYTKDFDLTEEERIAFCEKDIAKLYSMGVQPFILQAFAQRVSGRQFSGAADLLVFMREYSAMVAPYGHPDFES